MCFKLALPTLSPLYITVMGLYAASLYLINSDRVVARHTRLNGAYVMCMNNKSSQMIVVLVWFNKSWHFTPPCGYRSPGIIMPDNTVRLFSGSLAFIILYRFSLVFITNCNNFTNNEHLAKGKKAARRSWSNVTIYRCLPE